MAVDVAVSRAPSRASPSLLSRVLAVPARLLLLVLVAGSFLARFLASLAHAVPAYFPDEYIYGSIARGIAEHGRPVIRGGSAHFPALLEPILASPLWLAGDPMLAYRLTQAENAALMSLAAIPAYLLARKLLLGKGVALGCAALTVAAPALFFSAFVLACPVAYPLVIGALCAGVHALDSASARSQALFFVLAGLATFARVQYLVLPVAFLLAALVVERGRARAAARRFRVSLGLVAVPMLAVLALGASRVLGYYSAIFEEKLRPAGLAKWTGVDLMLLAYAAGWLIVPGAIVGVVLALRRPRNRGETGFAALGIAFGALLFVEATLYASNGAERFQERYLMTLVPLVPIAFALYASRGFPYRKAVALVAVVMLAASASFPLSTYTEGDGKQDSPLLFAVFRIQRELGVASGAAIVALLAAVLSAVAVGLTFWRSRGALVALGLTGAVFCAISIGATIAETENAQAIRGELMPPDLRWVDHAGLGHVAFVQTPGASAPRALQQLFWNRSVDSMLLLAGAPPPDSFRTDRLDVAGDGSLRVAGKAVRRPLLIQNFATSVELTGARRVGQAGTLELWRPAGTPRVSTLVVGRYSDGWLAGHGYAFVWPDRTGRVHGTLRLRISMPPSAEPLELRFRGVGIDRRVVLRPGESRELSFGVNAPKQWSLEFTSSLHATLNDGRAVSVKIEALAFERGGATRPAAPSARA